MEKVVFKTIDEMNAAGFLMYEKTYRAYLHDAGSFIKRSLKKSGASDAVVMAASEEELLVALHKLALEQLLTAESLKRTTDSWRKLRRELGIFYYAIGRGDIGSKFLKVKNPVPAEQRPRKTGKSKRLITVTLDVMDEMLGYLASKDENMCRAMCILGRDLGLRPAEMNDVQVLADDGVEMRLFVPGAKKTKVGEVDPMRQRGIDRELIAISTPELREAVSVCRLMTDQELNRCRERIRKAGKALWPRRKQAFCLYSLRYTVGSNLKAVHAGDSLGAIKIAAVMGHKNVSSAASYGNIRSSTGFGVPRTTEETMQQVVLDRDSFFVAAHKMSRGALTSLHQGPAL